MNKVLRITLRNILIGLEDGYPLCCILFVCLADCFIWKVLFNLPIENSFLVKYNKKYSVKGLTHVSCPLCVIKIYLLRKLRNNIGL